MACRPTFTLQILIFCMVLCIYSNIVNGKTEKKKTEDSDADKWKKKDIHDYSEADLKRLYDQWEIGLLSEINLQAHPGLVLLLEEGETIDDLMKLSPEEILIRWINYHLRNAQVTRQISNFSGDIKDSEAYIYLLNQIAPRDAGVTISALTEPDLQIRAEAMLMEADKIGCRKFVTSKDVCKGNAKLNLAFVANLFNTYPSLGKTR